MAQLCLFACLAGIETDASSFHWFYGHVTRAVICACSLQQRIWRTTRDLMQRSSRHTGTLWNCTEEEWQSPGRGAAPLLYTAGYQRHLHPWYLVPHLHRMAPQALHQTAPRTSRLWRICASCRSAAFQWYGLVASDSHAVLHNCLAWPASPAMPGSRQLA